MVITPEGRLSTQSRNRRHSGRVTGSPLNRSFAGFGAESEAPQEQSFICVYAATRRRARRHAIPKANRRRCPTAGGAKY
jgi:hypothetical protein